MEGIVLAALVTLTRCALGVVFIVSGLSKLRDHAVQFANIVLSYDLLPLWVATWFARLLPWVELIVGGALLLGIGSHLAALAACVLLLLFSLALVINLARGRRHPCGCFQKLEPIRWTMVYRNIAGLALLFAVDRLREHSWGLELWLVPDQPPPGWHSSALIGLLSLALVGSAVLVRVRFARAATKKM